MFTATVVSFVIGVVLSAFAGILVFMVMAARSKHILLHERRANSVLVFVIQLLLLLVTVALVALLTYREYFWMDVRNILLSMGLS